jgi:hypothetical protein
MEPLLAACRAVAGVLDVQLLLFCSEGPPGISTTPHLVPGKHAPPCLLLTQGLPAAAAMQEWSQTALARLR